jgi:L-fuculokinase
VWLRKSFNGKAFELARVMTPLVAVIDVGKSNAKLSFVDAQSGQSLWSVKRANRIAHTSGLRQLQIFAIERWLLDSFKSAPHKDRVSVIVPIAHGAAAVLVDKTGKILAAPDYEDPQFESVAEDYGRLRDPFGHTYSPNLPLGLNLARQLYFLESNQPQLFASAEWALLYPQYWAWRFSGVMASEVTSLGCHSDLWRPLEKSWSALALARGWAGLFPPLRLAGDILGPIAASVAAATGLNPSCRVSCGIHDSNASYLQHLLSCGRDKPFCVISSGTWTIMMANRADIMRLRAERDMLANVDAFSSPVCTARFMGGREYDLIAPHAATPNRGALEAVLRQRSMALPSFAPGGPFPAATGKLLRAKQLSAPQCATLATLYVALMSDLSIDLLGADGDIFLDGPLASNLLFGSVLAACRPHVRVFGAHPSDGRRFALSFLAGVRCRRAGSLPAAEPLKLAALQAYRRDWRELLPKAADAGPVLEPAPITSQGAR